MLKEDESEGSREKSTPLLRLRGGCRFGKDTILEGTYHHGGTSPSTASQLERLVEELYVHPEHRFTPWRIDCPALSVTLRHGTLDSQ